MSARTPSSFSSCDSIHYVIRPVTTATEEASAGDRPDEDIVLLNIPNSSDSVAVINVCVCAHSSSCRQEGHTLLILHPERSHYRTANQQSSIATPHQQLFKQAQEHWLITPELSFSLKDAPFFFLGLLLDGFFLLRLLRLFDPSETATLLMLPLSKSLSTSGSSSSLCAHGTKDFKIRLGYNRVPSA